MSKSNATVNFVVSTPVLLAFPAKLDFNVKNLTTKLHARCAKGLSVFRPETRRSAVEPSTGRIGRFPPFLTDARRQGSVRRATYCRFTDHPAAVDPTSRGSFKTAAPRAASCTSVQHRHAALALH